jgi:hypothetical protein
VRQFVGIKDIIDKENYNPTRNGGLRGRGLRRKALNKQRIEGKKKKMMMMKKKKRSEHGEMGIRSQTERKELR